MQAIEAKFIGVSVDTEPDYGGVSGRIDVIVIDSEKR
jgi:hypothetical protein